MMVLLIKVTAIERSLQTFVFAGGSMGSMGPTDSMSSMSSISSLNALGDHLRGAGGQAAPCDPATGGPAAAKTEPNPRLQAELSFPPDVRPAFPGAGQ